MSLLHEFKREEKFPSYFANRIQDYLSAAQMSLPTTANATTVTVTPDPTLGIAAVCIKGRWRFITAPVSRVHPGGAAGNYIVWAVAEDQKIVEAPKPLTDETNYAFELRITSGAEPGGVELAQKVAELHWTGAEIDSFHMLRNLVHGADLDQAAFSAAAGSLEWDRERTGALVPILKGGIVTSAELANNSVGSAALIALAVTEAKLAAEAVTEGKLAALSVSTAKIQAAAVNGEKLHGESVSTAAIVALAVTAAKLAAEAVTEGKLGAAAVSTAKIQNLAITAALLAAEAVETGKIKNLAVTAAKVAGEAIETAKIQNLAVTEAKLAALSVSEGKLVDGAVTSRKHKPTVGMVRYSASLAALTTVYQDVPGAKLEITPAVASNLLVVATFDLQVHAASSASTCVALGALNVDGVVQTDVAALRELAPATNVVISGTVGMQWLIPLTAALHTLKLQSKKENTPEAACGAATFTYQLFAS